METSGQPASVPGVKMPRPDDLYGLSPQDLRRLWSYAFPISLGLSYREVAGQRGETHGHVRREMEALRVELRTIAADEAIFQK